MLLEVVVGFAVGAEVVKNNFFAAFALTCSMSPFFTKLTNHSSILAQIWVSKTIRIEILTLISKGAALISKIGMLLALASFVVLEVFLAKLITIF